MEDPLETLVKGRDLITGLPREAIITDNDVREAISPSIDAIIESAKEVLEATPPELITDVLNRGIFVVGGGALLKGLGPYLEQCLKIRVHIADDPLTAVARGTGIILEDIGLFGDTLLQNEDDIPKTS
jgi:rod shape-determining protein MreB